MSELNIYPILINDYVAFMGLAQAKSEKDALKLARDKFPALEDMGELEVLAPIDFEEEKVIIVDPELYIINNNEEIRYWLGELGPYYGATSPEESDNERLAQILDNAFPEESEDKKDVKLLPAKSSEHNSGNKSDTKDDEDNGDNAGKSDEKDEEQKDETVWV
jgi:hypothetical protein